jgi:hypothetical protein
MPVDSFDWPRVIIHTTGFAGTFTVHSIEFDALIRQNCVKISD